ncbi:MAG: hypothetical protein KKA07_11085 [Bacteroidetes bacterium]|nr:hypothetical protein [Bacteroidota bacterium]MBU1719602.1 hypothetical protein [Bacteroidota bacterium]
MTENGRYIIHGAGGNTRPIIDLLLRKTDAGNIIVKDAPKGTGENIFGVPVKSEFSFLQSDTHIVSFGDNQHRAEVLNSLRTSGVMIGYVVSEDAKISTLATISRLNTMIYSLAFIGPGAQIGDNNLINTACIVEHDVITGKHCHIAPGSCVCGRVVLGDFVFIGAGAVVKDYIQICSNVTIGAGSVVVKNITEPGIYAGVPARKIR